MTDDDRPPTIMEQVAFAVAEEMIRQKDRHARTLAKIKFDSAEEMADLCGHLAEAAVTKFLEVLPQGLREEQRR